MRTRVKICGITRVDDALSAVKHGADAVGMVFYPPSPRNVDVANAAKIAAVLPPFICAVGLFVDADPDDIKHILTQVRLNMLQFHGEETPEQCRQFGLPYMKAIRVKNDTDLLQYAADFHDASALLLDTYIEGHVGGTGQIFDWKLIPPALALPVVLAGGLNPDNVSMAIKQVRPYAVDVSGGVEATKGIKSADKIAAFMRGVNNESL